MWFHFQRFVVSFNRRSHETPRRFKIHTASNLLMLRSCRCVKHSDWLSHSWSLMRKPICIKHHLHCASVIMNRGIVRPPSISSAKTPHTTLHPGTGLIPFSEVRHQRQNYPKLILHLLALFWHSRAHLPTYCNVSSSRKRLHEYEWESNQAVRRCPSGGSVEEKCKWTAMDLEYVNILLS